MCSSHEAVLSTRRCPAQPVGTSCTSVFLLRAGQRSELGAGKFCTLDQVYFIFRNFQFSSDLMLKFFFSIAVGFQERRLLLSFFAHLGSCDFYWNRKTQNETGFPVIVQDPVSNAVSSRQSLGSFMYSTQSKENKPPPRVFASHQGTDHAKPSKDVCSMIRSSESSRSQVFEGRK